MQLLAFVAFALTAVAPTPHAVSAPAHQRSGLVPLKTIKALPSQSVVTATTMPVGVITDARAWAKVKTAAKLALPKVNFNKQMVVYAVLGAQTNSLSFRSWTVKGNQATLQFHWSGIEPYYFDRTPAVFAIVDRGSIKTVNFVEVGKWRKGALSRGSVAVR